ncbi:MAG: endonuclease/exonuclease/phosphatase family protein [Pseudomonadota bacterium]
MLLWASFSASSETAIRIASYNVELTRDGPGLLLRDIRSGQDAQADAVAAVIAHARPDVLVLQNVDFDFELQALHVLQDLSASKGHAMPFAFALRPNTGLMSEFDLDGDGRTGTPRDAQGFGEFSGQGGMAVLSRYPIAADMAQDFSRLLWKDLPDATPPHTQHGPFPSSAAQDAQMLADVGHWVVPIMIGDQRLDVLTFHANPPVFDGAEDRNGRRNHDQMLFWQHFLNGTFGLAPDTNFVLIGNANIDPAKGEGRKGAIHGLLSDPRLQDPVPAAIVGLDENDESIVETDTVEWPAPGPGKRRVSYALPSSDLRVTASGIFWPLGDTAIAKLARAASRHRLVWVDIVVE